MTSRITIILDDDVLKKFREKQTKQIKNSAKSVSFSRVINEALRKRVN